MLTRFAILFWIFLAPAIGAQEAKKSPTPNSPAAAANPSAANQEEYLLRYKFQSGELIRWRVTHLGNTDTTIQGNTQSAKMRSVSTKLWRVTGVDAQGNLTFTHS